MSISKSDVEDYIRAWYERMGVDTLGVWNKQLAEIVLKKDEDELALDFRALSVMADALPEEDIVRCKDCKYYRDTFFETKINPTCDRHIDDRYGTLVGGITEDSYCSYGERKKK